MARVRRICLFSLLTLSLLTHLVGTVGVPLPVRALARVLEVEEEALAFHLCGCPVEKAKPCCCCSSGGCCATQAEPESTPAEAETITWVGGGWMSQCQGDVPAWWFSLPCSVIAPEPVNFTPEALTSLSHADEVAASLALSLLDPPPRS